MAPTESLRAAHKRGVLCRGSNEWRCMGHRNRCLDARREAVLPWRHPTWQERRWHAQACSFVARGRPSMGLHQDVARPRSVATYTCRTPDDNMSGKRAKGACWKNLSLDLNGETVVGEQ